MYIDHSTGKGMPNIKNWISQRYTKRHITTCDLYGTKN
jgi:hypothetical protein